MGLDKYIQIGVIITLVILIIILIANRGSKFSISNTIFRTSNDGLSYRVHKLHTTNIDEPGVESNSSEYILSILNNKAITLLKYLKNSHKTSVNSTSSMIERLLMYYNPDNLVENSPKNINGDTSYTYNDGSTIALCLRNTKNNTTNVILPDGSVSRSDTMYSIHDINTLTFVFIHELAHISIPYDGHPPEFWEAFRLLLIDSNNIGLIDLINYEQYPVKYCGMEINSNPAI